MGLKLYKQDENGFLSTKGLLQEKSQTRQFKRINEKKIGLNSMNRGIRDINIYKKLTNSDIVYNKNVLIWAPFEDYFPVDMRPSLETILDNSEISFSVIAFVNSECTINSLSNLTDFGLVIFDTHGSEGREFGTCEIATEQNLKNYSVLLKSQQIGTWTNITIGFNNNIAQREDIFCIRFPYIASLNGTFANSIIFNGSCESTKNMEIKDAFLNKGAATYFGFDEVVNVDFCKDKSDEIVRGLAVDLSSISEIFISGQNDPVEPNAEFEMFGNEEIHYTTSLFNGNFETGDLTGWVKDGDGRVITRLGYLLPPEGLFMGIISTGLGFTDSTGEISQSFKVNPENMNLNFKWNFLSEEFEEYIGSKYQDYFKIKIINSVGQENILFDKSIDIFANEYPLQFVSPDIVFDQGDVYMTGWNTFSYNLTNYNGEIITLTFSAGDIGDSVYDSALLIDDIKIE